MHALAPLALLLTGASSPPSHAEIALELPGPDGPLVLELRSHSVRSEGFRLLVDEGGGALVPTEPAPVATLRGELRSRPGSVAAGSLREGRLRVDVQLGDGRETWTLEASIPTTLTGGTVIHRWGPRPPGSTPPAPPCPMKSGSPACGPRSATSSGALQIPSFGLQSCELAADADHEFFLANGSSVPDTLLDIEDVVNRVSLLFEPDAELTFELGTVIVRSTPDDPYSTGLSSAAMNVEFAAVWNGAHTDAHRDVAHLFTGRFATDGFLGYGNIGKACDVDTAYAWSRSKWTQDLALRAELTAHELGHNWGANHCFELEDCAIMCGTNLLGCSDEDIFGQAALFAFAQRKLQTGCLSWVTDPPPPVVTSVTPAAFGVLDQLDVTLTGSGFYTATQITIGSATLVRGPVDSDFVIVDDSLVLFDSPLMDAPGAEELRVFSQGGPSAALPVEVSYQDPPVYLSHTAVDLAIDDEAVYRFAAPPESFAVWLLAPFTLTIPYQGWTLLVTDLFFLQPLDANGMASVTVVIPASAGPLPGQIQTGFVSQAAYLDPTLELILITGPAQTVISDSNRGLNP